MKCIKNNKRNDKSTYLMEYIYNRLIVSWIVPMLAKTKISPNCITIFNLFIALLAFYMADIQKYIAVSILIIIYAINDELDGNLARYKKQFSNFGAKLDSIIDFVFYNGIYIFLGKKCIDFRLIIGVIIIINLYGLLATYYIVPQIRKITKFRRLPLKRWFLNKGFIFGMDVGMMGIVTSILLILGCVKEIYYVIIVTYSIDMCYRLLELKYNKSI